MWKASKVAWKRDCVVDVIVVVSLQKEKKAKKEDTKIKKKEQDRIIRYLLILTIGFKDPAFAV